MENAAAIDQLERATLTIKQAAPYIGISTDTLYLMVKQRKIPHIRAGQNRILFRKATIDLWMENQEAQSTNEINCNGIRKIQQK